MTISVFAGKDAFLSNFYLSPIEYANVVYPTAEHLFQACKAAKFEEREWVRTAPTPAEAKKRGKKVAIVENWTGIRVGMMVMVVKLKFDQNPDLKVMLMATGHEPLIEGNTWNDTFWGVCRGKGHNWLGKILMQYREDQR